MFDILEADIVVFQETKIQRKDLVDDMVLIPGWDCYWSLPRHKKGYSGVVIYTRQSVCAPIRAEEGITGVLCPPGSSTSFRDLPNEQQIGGYPSKSQLEKSAVDVTTVDSEGRCVILEFPAFVLLGVYSPANRDETRDDFRLGFIELLDARVRNLVSKGKRVILTGDLNISRDEIDTANAQSSMRKHGLTTQEYISMPARRIFNHLLEGGKVLGHRDEDRRLPAMWDLCRGFHPSRQGMFTCWEQKVNARPGNYGSRIDYVICSLGIKEWFMDANIQEGLLGSDHCPVYAVIKDRITLNGKEYDVRDVVNPPGIFIDGVRKREHMTKDILPMSGKLIPEFDGRRSIRDMFARNPSVAKPQSSSSSVAPALSPPNKMYERTVTVQDQAPPNVPTNLKTSDPLSIGESSATVIDKSRPSDRDGETRPSKRFKSTSFGAVQVPLDESQRSLRNFFQPKRTPTLETVPAKREIEKQSVGDQHPLQTTPAICHYNSQQDGDGGSQPTDNPRFENASQEEEVTEGDKVIIDPVQSKDSWSRIFTKPVAPRCEGHDEPCVSMLTKKNGINRGRSFWMCSRPLGPSGNKEKNTQWRCHTFIWCSDWNTRNAG
ncbi:MAG: hypothetical protein Q9167_007791 [Letrouitia subvulpina]